MEIIWFMLVIHFKLAPWFYYFIFVGSRVKCLLFPRSTWYLNLRHSESHRGKKKGTDAISDPFYQYLALYFGISKVNPVCHENTRLNSFLCPPPSAAAALEVISSMKAGRPGGNINGTSPKLFKHGFGFNCCNLSRAAACFVCKSYQWSHLILYPAQVYRCTTTGLERGTCHSFHTWRDMEIDGPLMSTQI